MVQGFYRGEASGIVKNGIVKSFYRGEASGTVKNGKVKLQSPSHNRNKLELLQKRNFSNSTEDQILIWTTA